MSKLFFQQQIVDYRARARAGAGAGAGPKWNGSTTLLMRLGTRKRKSYENT